MLRIGIDVGGTNTDAVLVDGGTVLAAAKTATTGDVTGGIRTVLARLLERRARPPGEIGAVMIGTTHFVNAVVQRRGLNKVAAIRIGLPSGAALAPMVDWPADLRALVRDRIFLIEGGHEYDGAPLVPLDERALREAARSLRDRGVAAAAVSAVFSPLNPEGEERAAAILKEEIPDLKISLSSSFGRIGLLERENVAILNAGLQDLAGAAVGAFEAAKAACGIDAPLFITQNDGTVAGAAAARDFPVFGFASGPTNSMRGAALLSGVDDAVVVDVGGTTSDVGCLKAGYPREANNVVEVGGVRTLFRMPDVLSLGIGGGTLVQPEGMKIGPESVGFRLTQEALVFGGGRLTLTDVAVAAGLLDVGERGALAHLSAATVEAVVASVHQRLAEAVDMMKTEAGPVPLLAVGGGAMLCPPAMPGISGVEHVAHAAVANAVGAAMAQVSGEVDHVFRDMERAALLREAEGMARERAVRAGADPDALKVVDMEDLPLAYLPGNAVRARVRVVGDIAGQDAGRDGSRDAGRGRR